MAPCRRELSSVRSPRFTTDWQIRIAILSLPLKEKWRHFLQEPRHFSLRLRARGEFRAGSSVQEIPRALDDAADQQHAHSLPFCCSVRFTWLSHIKGPPLRTLASGCGSFNKCRQPVILQSIVCRAGTLARTITVENRKAAIC
jgi:hypothetical protein